MVEECEKCKNSHVKMTTRLWNMHLRHEANEEILFVWFENIFSLCNTVAGLVILKKNKKMLTSFSISVPTGSPLISRILSPTWIALRTSGLMSIPLTLKQEQASNLKSTSSFPPLPHLPWHASTQTHTAAVHQTYNHVLHKGITHTTATQAHRSATSSLPLTLWLER